MPILTRWEAEELDGIQVTLYWAVECYRCKGKVVIGAELLRQFISNYLFSLFMYSLYKVMNAIFFSSLIEYKLFFRPATIPQINDDLTDDRALIKLTVPADRPSENSGQSFLHTKSFTLRGLNRSSIYQAAVQARNKYGWSLLSSLCYFATFPSQLSNKTHQFQLEFYLCKITCLILLCSRFIQHKV